MFLQKQGGELVANDSRQTSTAEKNYHSLGLELLAVVGSTRHFGYLLLGIVCHNNRLKRCTIHYEEGRDNPQYCKMGIEATGV